MTKNFAEYGFIFEMDGTLVNNKELSQQCANS